MYKLLSHNDLDGVGCGILAKLAFEGEVKVRYNSISSLNREVEAFLEEGDMETFLFITDMSPNEENEQKLNEYVSDGGDVQLIDHHKTALHMNDYEWGMVLVEYEGGLLTSATSLFYEYLVAQGLLQPNDAIAEFVELVRQYDTWEWEKNGNQMAHRLNSLFFLMTIDEFEQKMIERLQSGSHFEFNEFELKLLEMEEDKIARYIRKKKREIVQNDVDGLLAGIVFAESYNSELGNELGKAFMHLDYIAIVNMGSKRIALRTIHDDIDVSEIAGSFGGGGHQKASGCSLSNEAYKLYVEEAFHLEPIQEDAAFNKYNLKQNSYGTLYRNYRHDLFLISQKGDVWGIEKGNTALEQTFPDFEAAERFLKRTYSAWLVKDDVFVEHLLGELKRKG